MAEQDLFLGTWQLVPELSLYSTGMPPLEATYVIRSDGTRIDVDLKWRLWADGPEQAVSYGAPMDGTPTPLPGATDGPDALTLTRIDGQTLDSAALKAGETIAFGRRRASNDGTLLAVVQEANLPDGTTSRNFQIYRRLPG